MTAHRVVSVKVEAVAHDDGHWCNRCRLSTGIRMWVAVIARDRMHLQQRVRCDECGTKNITIET